MFCDICNAETRSYHHIIPIEENGSTARINKVPLCKEHHDIVESYYQKFGLVYTPHLKKLIQLKYLPLKETPADTDPITKAPTFLRPNPLDDFVLSTDYKICRNCFECYLYNWKGGITLAIRTLMNQGALCHKCAELYIEIHTEQIRALFPYTFRYRRKLLRQPQTPKMGERHQ